MKHITDEVAVVNDILENGRFKHGYGVTVSCLAKYFKENGLDEKDNKQSILEVLRENDVEFEQQYLYKMMDEIISSTYKNDKKLISLNEVPITKKEWETIRALEDKHKEKLLFTLLVNVKTYGLLKGKHNVWYNGTRSSLFSEAKVSGKFRNIREQMSVLREFYLMGIIEKSKSTRQFSLKINFVDYNDEDIAFFVTNFDDVTYHYRKETGENVGLCKCCGKVFKKPKGKGKGRVSYCSDKCKDYMSKIKKQIENEKYRKKIKKTA